MSDSHAQTTRAAALYATGTLAHRVSRWDGCVVEEIDDHVLISIAARRGKLSALSSRWRDVYEMDLPGPLCSTEYRGICVMWTGEQQWFASAPMHSNFVQDVQSHVTELASVTDQTDGWVGIEISGRRAPDILELLCPVDLHAGSFPTQKTIRTAIEYIGVQITRRNDVSTFSILSFRSTGRSLFHAIAEAATTICGPNAG